MLEWIKNIYKNNTMFACCCEEFFDSVIKLDPTAQLWNLSSDSLPNPNFKLNRMKVDNVTGSTYQVQRQLS